MQRKSITRSVVLAFAGVLTLAGLLLLAGSLPALRAAEAHR